MNISTSLNVFEINHPIEQQIRRCKEAGFLALDSITGIIRRPSQR